MTRDYRLRTHAPDQTRDLAAALAGVLRRGDVVALTGELGAGKTCFVQGAAAALGVGERVTSPSFLLRRDYPGDVPVLHLDVYRLDTLQEIVELGWDEALEGTHVTFVEWGDAASPLLPTDHLEIEFRLDLQAAPSDQPVSDEPPRDIVVRLRGNEWLRRSRDVEDALKPWAVA